MKLALKLAIVAAGLGGLFAGAARAQGVLCLDQQSGQVDQGATQTFAEMQARMDPALAQALAGGWLSEIPSPATGQISRLAVWYGADGSLSYQNQVCDRTGACSDYQGIGAWAAVALGGGQFSAVQMVSDLVRNRECTGFSGEFLDANTIRTGAGVISRRMP